MNQTIYVTTLGAVFALIYGSAPTPDGELDLYVSFSPCHWHGLRPPAEL